MSKCKTIARVRCASFTGRTGYNILGGNTMSNVVLMTTVDCTVCESYDYLQKLFYKLMFYSISSVLPSNELFTYHQTSLLYFQ